MASIVIGVAYYLSTNGYSYYSLPIEERFYHPKYAWFKPSGLFGQGLGVIGTGLITFGVVIYIIRKRYGVFERFIRLKYLLEFHIFLCTLGPLLILFHTTFKFGGIVSIAFWSMVAVVLSGVVGRYIYIQIPRSISGRELSIQEVQLQRQEFASNIRSNKSIGLDTINLILSSDVNKKWGMKTFIENTRKIRQIKSDLKKGDLDRQNKEKLISMVKVEMALTSKVGRLHQMQQIFKYWHVIHMPFAIIMLIVVIIHVGVSVTLGYKWIF